MSLRHAMRLGLLLVVSIGAHAEVDPATGFEIDENWELVRAHCTACHSARIVTQNRGSRETWLARIRWMQDKQGLWPFDPATEAKILDYLQAHYGPSEGARRPPIPTHLMPENPLARTGGETPPATPDTQH